ncbi:hypothetical protein MCW82_07010 [Azospirillum doebereinerae]|uniref:hypothetical protein n=1 Tax=Azospirillum doebereinerae TaxID=92933 RepID=UPI001EE56752|nr:hypothetical protein [Azospirillum doebereinerae]MCG5239517.1 hypothetical protein [Azospirillum doebereinerae]
MSYSGSGRTPGNSGDADLAGAGYGGSAGAAGSDGRLVIYIDGVLAGTLNYTGSDQAFTIT